MEKTKIVLWKGKKIRGILHNNEWWFSVVDAARALTESTDAGAYWRKLKQRLIEEGSEAVTFCHGLKLEAPDGKKYETDCANTEGMLRIIQSIPSPKAEPFKLWLAKVGYERIQEIENPELAAQRARTLYRVKGYPESWIEKRMRGIEVRETLTNEWKNRGAKENIEFGILTNEILKGAFDMTAVDYKKFKGLKRENLRDHMDDIELVLTILGEATATRLHQGRDSQGFQPLQKDAKDGGDIAGRTRKDIEQKLGKPIVSRKNFKHLSRKKEIENKK
ncbi:MAG: phage antirepressor protein [Candidatus Moranbacteria bacterium RIFOXYA12_FULL_44_15]|nr:MAG: phage antirepressor protein [Candidatus Moranbacteria bacterium RIFOXYA12_FULL_44_15]OGI35471.1 MAG: phage antirepressor protein [Candidatus Moranbacteria bacterium RIFOXYA2_FULL_43_15]